MAERTKRPREWGKGEGPHVRQEVALYEDTDRDSAVGSSLCRWPGRPPQEVPSGAWPVSLEASLSKTVAML